MKKWIFKAFDSTHWPFKQTMWYCSLLLLFTKIGSILP